MKVHIHRGANQIGGICVEIESLGESILLDAGSPLDNNDDNIIPVSVNKNNISAIVISHSHRDHIGLAHQFDVPVYMGEKARNLLKESSFWLGYPAIKNIQTYIGFKQFKIGPFKITPYPVDHSCFDSYSLLIESEEKKIFYTGDFRKTGYTSKKTQHLIHTPPKKVDLLLMEGTLVGATTHKQKEECSLTNEITKACRNHGAIFIAASSQNIDRIVTLIKCANQLKRKLVIDAYCYNVLKSCNIESLNNILNNLAVYIPIHQRIKIKNNSAFNKLCNKTQRVFEHDILSNQDKYLILFRNSHIKIFKDTTLKEPLLIFSMYQQYYDDDTALQSFVDRHNIDVKFIHTSGHADIKTLQEFAVALAPKMIVPIHTEQPEKYKELFENVYIASCVDLKI